MPSASILAEKQATVAALADSMKNAEAGVLVGYQGITVGDDTALRAELRGAGVVYRVYKNSITSRACEEAGYEQMKPHLAGMTAIATSESDPVAPARILKSYADKIPTFELLCGFLEGEFLDKEGVEELAGTPNKETMVCKIMGSLKSPVYGLVYALQAIIDKAGEDGSPEQAAPEDAAPAPEEAAPAAE